jgi:peptidoglycan/xylan/chitin deacetylase (PgdA/CDA1 family)
LTFGIVVAAASVVVPADAANRNLISNPSAETVVRGVPSGWAWASNGSNVSSRTVGSGAAKSGHRYLRTTTTRYRSGAAWWFTPTVPVKAKSRYAFGEYYRSTVPTLLEAAFTVGRRTVWVALGTVPPAAGWTPLNVTVTAPAGATKVRFAHLLRAVGHLDVDAVSAAVGAPSGSAPAVAGAQAARVAPAAPAAVVAKPAAGKGIVSVTFDDGYANQVTNAFPVMKAKKIPGTFYLISGWLGSSSYMSVSQAKELQAAGSEIGSHTVDHKNLKDLSVDQMDTELSGSKTQLEKDFGPITSFAYPEGGYTAQAQAEVAKYYGNARTTDSGQNVKGSYGRYTIAIGYVFNSTTTATVQGWLATAKADNAWLILCYHRVADDQPGNAYTASVGAFSAQMAAVQASGLATVTVKDGVALTS